MHGVLPAGDIPVLARTDALVVGGSFAGLACALELARNGKSVMIIEPRTYLGRECTATLRPWFTLERGQRADALPWLIGQVLKLVVSATGVDGTSGRDEVPLYPDRLKCALEDLLQENGIGLLYASLPVGIGKHRGRIDGVIVANKTGRQMIRCGTVVDATETALLARLCGEVPAEYAGGGIAEYARTLEFTQAEGVEEGMLPVPDELQLAGSCVRLREGYRGPGHVLAEIRLALDSADSREADRSRECEARYRGMRLAAHLIRNVPAFSKAVFCSASHELLGPFPASDGAVPPVTAGKADLSDAMAVREPGVWSLYKAVYATGDIGLLDPAPAAAIGEELARRILEKAEPVDGGRPAPRPEQGTRSTLPDDRWQAEIRVPDLLADRVGERAAVPATEIPALPPVDVAVAGGGSSGASAAITAAREGMRTLLVDLNPGLGGTGTFGGVDSYWFGRNTAFAARIHESVLAVQEEIRYKGPKWNIEAKMHALLQAADSAGAELLFNAVTFGAARQGDRVCGVLAATRWGPVAIPAEVVIDATGDGDIAAFAGASYVYGSEKDHAVMWYSLAQYAAPGKLQNNFTSMVDVSNVLDYTRAILAGRRRGNACHDHGIYVATRESRHILGDAVMRLTDQLLHRRWPDVVNLHFSNHDVKGVSGADWVNVGLIPPNLEIEIPYAMMLPKGLEGILVAGKAVSATHDALPAIRMQADLENLGAVAALAASEAVRLQLPPRGIDVRRLQERLIREGVLPGEILGRDLAFVRYDDEGLRLLVEAIEADRPLYDYSNMRMTEVYTGRIPFAEICSAGPRGVPHLAQALEGAEGARRIRLAQALAMLGDARGVPVLIEAIMKDLQGPELPPRTAEIMYVQLPPDHGAMPDAAYLLYSLAGARDKRSIPVWNRVAELFHPSEEDFRDTWKGMFYFADAVCQGAERLGAREAIPALERLHRCPLLNGRQCERGFQPDYFLERQAMLELAIGRALARCGSRKGYEILIRYLRDVRSLLAKHALLELRRISGEALALSADDWTNWLEKNRPDRHTYPLELRLDFEPDSSSFARHYRQESLARKPR